MQLVDKPDAVDKCKTGKQFQNIDLSDSSNLGFGVDQII